MTLTWYNYTIETLNKHTEMTIAYSDTVINNKLQLDSPISSPLASATEGNKDTTGQVSMLYHGFFQEEKFTWNSCLPYTNNTNFHVKQLCQHTTPTLGTRQERDYHKVTNCPKLKVGDCV